MDSPIFLRSLRPMHPAKPVLQLSSFFALAASAVAAESSKLVSTDVIPGLTVPSGTTVTLLSDAATHGTVSPTALAHGTNGELYVAETHRFRFGIPDNRGCLFWVVDDTASRTTADRMRMYEKWQNETEENSMEFLTAKSEVVRTLSQPEASGTYAKQQVFADGFNHALDGTAAGIFEYEGTVYLACIPKIYALRDTDGDGKADESKVIQDGFGVHVSLSGHDLNGFVLGPDGRIYGSMGDRGFHGTTREGKTYNLHNQGFVFRFDPDGSNFEVIHTGLRNPKEIAFDDQGNLFSVDNNCDQGDKARIVYIIDGGDTGWHMGHQILTTFRKQAGLENPTPVAWLSEKLWELPNPAQPAYLTPPIAHLTSGPSGLAYHPGAGFLESEVGRFFICDYRGSAANSAIWSFRMEPSGAGMKMSDAHYLNQGVAATDVDFSWDGKLVVSDFVGGWTSHNDGRVYSVAANAPYRAAEAQQAARLVKEGFSHRGADELVQLLSHPDQRIRIRAQLELTRRPEALGHFHQLVLKADNPLARLHGVWGLGVIARRTAAVLPTGETKEQPHLRQQAAEILKQLAVGSLDMEIRCQAIKALGECGLEVPAIDCAKLISANAPRLQFFATLAAGRMKNKASIPAILDLLANTGDLHLRLAGAHALSLLSSADELAALSDHPSTTVRLAAVVALRKQQSPALTLFLTNSEPSVIEEAIRAINDLEIAEARAQVAALLDSPAPKDRSLMNWQRVLHSAYRLGGEANARRILATALDPTLPDPVRSESFRLLGEWAKPHPVDQSTGHHAAVPERSDQIVRTILADQLLALVRIEGPLLESALEITLQYQLDISALPLDSIRAIAFNKEITSAARVDGMKLYISRKPGDLLAFVTQLAADSDDVLAIAALRYLADHFTAHSIDGLVAATQSDSPYRQQQAWNIAAKLPLPEAAELIAKGLADLQKSKGAAAGALELIEAAGQRTEPAVKEALASFQAAQASSSDPMEKWLTALEGGDVKRGGELFNSHPAAQCMRCHAAGHGGGNAGPNLRSIGREKDRRYLLEAVVDPAATVALGYGIATATLKGGKTVGGIIVDETTDHVDFDSAGTIQRVLRSDIQSMTPPISSMPPMAMLLKPDEVRDIVAWLAEQKGRPAAKPKRPTPVLVKP